MNPKKRGVRPGLKRACLVLVLVLAVFSPLLGSASACPFCDGGPEGINPVKEAVFGTDFWPNLLATAVPFGFFLGVVAAIHFGPWGRPSQPQRRPGQTPEESK